MSLSGSAIPHGALNHSLPPINKIPPEILGDIFVLTLPDINHPFATAVAVVGDRWKRPTGKLDTPWSLGQVCRHWRVVAVSFPSLWTAFVISTAMLPRELYLLQLQLERSKAASLDVCIKFTSSGRRRVPFDVFLRTIAAESGRWHRVRLQFDSPYSPHDAFTTLSAMPLLSELRFSGQTISRLPLYYVYFEAAPNLKRIILGDAGYESVPTNRLPWQQITTYKATYPDGATHLRNLRAFAATLVECDIGFVPTTLNTIVEHRGTLTLPHLRRLIITNTRFLDGLKAPGLRDLYVLSTEHTIRFLAVSNCSLTRLTLIHCADASESIIAFLQQIPTLTGLQIDFAITGVPNKANIVLSALADEGLALLPNLASLSWSDLGDTTDRGAFADMVEKRWRATRRLRFVAVYSNRLRMKGHGLRLRALMNEGMDVVIFTARKARPAVKRWRKY